MQNHFLGLKNVTAQMNVGFGGEHREKEMFVETEIRKLNSLCIVFHRRTEQTDLK